MSRRRMMYDSLDKNTLLLLHFDNDVKDSSLYGRTVSGGVTNYVDGIFGKAGNLGGGATVEFTLPELSLNSGYTIEFWVRMNSIGDALILNAETSGNLRLRISVSDGNIVVQGAGYQLHSKKAINDKTYHHIALCAQPAYRNSYFFVDGVKITGGQQSSSTDFTVGTNFKIGWPTGNPYCNIDELRISDIARYTTNFTPPTKPFK